MEDVGESRNVFFATAVEEVSNEDEGRLLKISSGE